MSHLILEESAAKCFKAAGTTIILTATATITNQSRCPNFGSTARARFSAFAFRGRWKPRIFACLAQHEVPLAQFDSSVVYLPRARARRQSLATWHHRKSSVNNTLRSLQYQQLAIYSRFRTTNYAVDCRI